MTVIVGVTDGERTAIAADGLCTIGPVKMATCENEKLVSCGAAVVGIAGLGVWKGYLKAYMKTSDGLGESAEESEIADFFCGFLEWCSSNRHFTLGPDEDDNVVKFGSDVLIAAPSGLWFLDCSLGVTRCDPFWTLGSGRGVALGYLHGVYDSGMPVDVQARQAVEAACKFSDGCGPPVSLEVVTRATP